MAKYGAGAYPGTNPIGPSKDYVSPLGISESLAHEVVGKTSDLTQKLSSMQSDQLLWLAADITVPNAAYGKTVKSGVILGGKQARVKWDYYGPTSGYMIPLLNMESKAVISGVVFEGGGGFGHYGQGAGPCCIRASGSERIIVENCNVSHFRGGGVWLGDGAASITNWLDDNQRNIIRHCDIRHIQQYGFGYGVGAQGATQSFLVEACIADQNRHSIMISGGSCCYEVRYSIFGESVYANSDTGPATIGSHQIDAHGGGWLKQSYKAGRYLWIHHNTLKRNDRCHNKPHIMIRGVVSGWCLVERNWSEYYSQANPPDESVSNMLVQLAEEEGAAWQGPSKKLSLANVTCRDNWYGAAAPPVDTSTKRQAAIAFQPKQKGAVNGVHRIHTHGDQEEVERQGDHQGQ